MAQPSVVDYFNTRKRSANEDANINRAKKVLLLDSDILNGPGQNSTNTSVKVDNKFILTNNKLKLELSASITALDIKNITSPTLPTTSRNTVKKTPGLKSKKVQQNLKNGTIDNLLNSIRKEEKEYKNEVQQNSSTNSIQREDNLNDVSKIFEPTTPVTKRPELSLPALKRKLNCSSRLAELKASIGRFKDLENQLELVENKTNQTKEACTLKGFKSIELEVNTSPQKPQSPQKAYLSPKKDGSIVRKNLFRTISPTKNALPIPKSPEKYCNTIIDQQSLSLPYRYRCLAEMFRALDTVCQILFNRKEIITFKKLKPAVEEMIKRNLTEKHLSQIQFLYPDAFKMHQEKMRDFGSGTRKEHWELVLLPQFDHQTMTSEVLLERRRKFYLILIEKLKDYHQEFLETLDPPIKIPQKSITRWHPQFNIEKVPDIEMAVLPRPPYEERLMTGSQVLEKARLMFNCNTRMERALKKLKESRGTQAKEIETIPGSILKGIPQALLEKVRQKQAAKALESMTRSTAKEKEVQLYSMLPEIARLLRNLFVSEKKNVLPLDLVLDKLCNSSKMFVNKIQMEEYLRTIVKEDDQWMKFEEVRGGIFIKICKNQDLSLIVNKFQCLVEQKKLQ